MKTFTICLIFFTSISLSFGQQLSWTPIADIPVARYAPVSFMIGDRFFVATGLDTLAPRVGLKDLYEYDFNTDSWMQRASLPDTMTVFAASAFTIGNKGYIVNGERTVSPGGYSERLYSYDPALDSWTQLSSFIGAANYTGTAFSIGQTGYLGLGFSPYTSDFYSYNSSTDTWAPLSPFPGTARQSASSFVINGIAYVGLGGVQTGSIFNNFTDFYKYDPATGWSAVASLPGIARRDAAGFAFGGKGYIIGGVGTNATDIYNDIWEYDPATNVWGPKDSFEQRFRNGAYASNGNLAIVGTGQNKTLNLSSKMWKTGARTAVSDISQDESKVRYANGQLNITSASPSDGNSTVKLFDVNGRKVMQEQVTGGEKVLHLPLTLANGAYIFVIEKATGLRNTGKIIVAQ